MRRPDGIYKAITSSGDLRDLINVITDIYDEIGVDTETTSLNYLNCELLGISIAYKHSDLKGVGYYIPIKRNAPQEVLWDNPNFFLNIEDVRKLLNPIFANPNITKYLHNAKFDMHVLSRHGFTLEQPIFDTMIGAWILGNVAGARYGLKDLTENKLNIKMLTFDEVTGKDKDFSKTPLELAVKYAAPDADMTLRLGHLEKDVFDKFKGLIPTRDLEMQHISVLQSMEAIGALVNKNYLNYISKPLLEEIRKYEKEVTNVLGNININSDEQLIDAINKKIHPKSIKDAKSDTVLKVLNEALRIDNVDEALITCSLDEHPELKFIDNYIRYSKRRIVHSTFIEGILSKLPENNRVHTEYKQNKKTGRLSSKEPNLQNIPTKKSDDYYARDLPQIRRAFIASDGCKIVAIDYSQLELRITAHRANEQSWIDAFHHNVDIHKATAAAVLNIPLLEVTKEQRRKAKAINFGLLYGMTEFGLSRRLGITISEAKEFIDTYFSNLTNIRKYIDDRTNEVMTRRYVETEIGRRLYFNYDKSNQTSCSAAIREGINMPIQGQAADIVKKAMNECYDFLRHGNYKTNMIMQVHDEIVFDMYIPEMVNLIPELTDIMSNVYKLRVPLAVDVEYGDNWEDIKDWT